MVSPLPKRHTSHMGQIPPQSSVLPNSNIIPEDYNPGDEGNPAWWEYLDYDSEEDYNANMRNLQQIRAKERANVNVYYTDDDSSEYFGYSYDEIIAMYEEGADIPTEVLNWAKSMAQNDISTESEPIQADDAEALYLSLKQNPDMNLKTITKIFSDKCKEKGQELNLYNEELTTLLKEVSVMKSKVEILKESAESEITPLKNEWDDLNYKISHNIPLTPEENKRAKFLRGKFGEIDSNYKSETSSEIVDIGIYIDKISEISQKIEIANSYSRVSKTILDELSSPEASEANAGIITKSDIQTEETLSNDDMNANFTDTLYDAVSSMDLSANDTNNKVFTIMDMMGEMAEIGGFQLDDPNRAITTDFENGIDFSALDNNEPNSKSGDINQEEDNNKPTQINNNNSDNVPAKDTENDNNEPIPARGNNPDNIPPENLKGGNPTGKNGNTPPVEDTPEPETTNKPKHRGNENGEITEEDANKMINQGKTMQNTAKSGLNGVKSQTSDVKSETAGTKTDANNSKSDKKAAIAKEKQVKKDLKDAEKAKKKYDKDLKNTEKQVESQKKKTEESANRMDELEAKAQSVQDSAGDDGEAEVKDELTSIATDMAGIAAETKAQSKNLDKSIKLQNNLRKKSTKSLQKVEKSFANMITSGKEYQKTNDTTQKTANTVGTVAGTVSTLGMETNAVGKGLKVYGTTEKATGQTLLSGVFTSAIGAALTSAGIATDVVGKTVETVGKVAQYTGMAGSLASTTTTTIASNARKSIDSFTDTSTSAQAESKNDIKEIKSTDKDIKSLTKDNATLKKDAAKFQAQAMEVANMGGAGGLSQVQAGGGERSLLPGATSGGSPASVKAGAIGNENATGARSNSPITTNEVINGNEEPNENEVTGENEPENNLEAEFPEFEGMTVELNMEEEPEPEFVYNPEGAKGYGNSGNDYIPSKKPSIKAPEETFNQPPNKRKKR